LNTFCLSTKAYQHLFRRFKRGAKVDGFYTPDDTNIPQLMEFASKLTLNARQNIADKIINETNLLKVKLDSWAQETDENTLLLLEQRNQLKEALNEHSSALKSVRSLKFYIAVF